MKKTFWVRRVLKRPLDLEGRFLYQAAFVKVGKVLATIYKGETQIGFLKSWLVPQRPAKDPDPIETLLGTGSLNATNTRDFIYDVLPMTHFPHKPMSRDGWVCARAA